MDGNKVREQSVPDSAEMCAEFGDDQPEEPPQRWRDEAEAYQGRQEKIRLIALGFALLSLLAGFLLYLLSKAVFPLFGAMVIVYLGYRRFDYWLATVKP